MHLRWSGGGEARVVAVDAATIVLRSTVPSPPGSRIEGTLLELPSGSVRVKVHSSKRQPEGDFLLQGRPLDLSRETRGRLEELVSAARPAQREQDAQEAEGEERGGAGTP